MVYVFVGYDYLPNLDSPESWFNVAKVYFGLLTHLSKENTVYNINQINCERFCMHEGVHNYFLKTGKSKNYFPLKINLLIKSLSPDVVLVQGLHNPLQVFQLALILPKRTKIIAQHHAEKPFNGIKKYIQRMADPFINAYLFASSAIGIDWLNKGNLGAGKKIFQVMEVSSVFYPVDKKLSRIKTGIQGEPTFLWVGRLNNNKDPLTVVTAFLMFLDIQPRARLYMIFHTDELSGEIKKLLNQSKHKDGVLLVGKIKHEELLYWYNSANFFISGSHYEGSGDSALRSDVLWLRPRGNSYTLF